jgi:cytoskeletal protein RodZ
MRYEVGNNFEILKNMSTEELYSKTYITLENIEAIKSKNFAVFTRFKLMGFIDILSKRLNLDLSDFRDEANKYFDLLEPVEVIEEPAKKNTANSIKLDARKMFYFIVGLFLLLIFLVGYSLISSQSTNDLEDVQVSPPSNITEKLPPLEPLVSENNQTETNTTNLVTNEVAKTKIQIIPTRKIWVGIINLDTKEKKDYTTTDALEIDSSQNQIIVINGAYLSLMVGETEKKYNYEGRIRFICKDGKIEEISYTNFKELNNGKAWN